MKTGFWLRNGKGKLAGATVYQQNGETVMREVVTPNNPQTEKQMIQRILMHTVMGAYSKMKAITDHSFEGMKAGRDTMGYFLKQNVQFAREKVAAMQQQGLDFYEIYNFAPLGVRGFTPNQYQVSMGSLPQIFISLDSDNPNSVWIPGIQTEGDIPTYAEVAKSLGLQRGDQLTFIVIKTIGTGESFGSNEFKFSRVILDPTNPDYTGASMDTPFFSTEDGSINLPSVRNEGNFRFGWNQTGLGLGYNDRTSTTIVAACVIASRENTDKTWLRSTSYLSYRGNVGQVYSLGDCLNMATKGVSHEIYAANELYLNNAGQGGGAGAATGESEQGGITPVPSITPAIAGASVNNVVLTAGTQRTFEESEGTTFPVTKTVTVSANNVSTNSECAFKVVNKQTGEQVAMPSGHWDAEGKLSVNVSCAKDVVYEILWVPSFDDLDDTTATGYTFKVTEANGGGLYSGD